jgi:hypothetical protein
LVEQTYGARDAEASGLSPWWVYPGAALQRVALVPALSEQEQRISRLRERLDIYRLAMGQPHAVRESLADQLSGALTMQELRGFAVDLSAARLRKGADAKSAECAIAAE